MGQPPTSHGKKIPLTFSVKLYQEAMERWKIHQWSDVFHHNMLCFAPAKEDYMDSLSYHFVGTMTCRNVGGLKSQT